MTNLDRDLNYIAIDLKSAKIFIFVDGLFANNKDLSFQLRYKVILVNKTTENKEFEITDNLLYYSSTKSKRVTRSVLASEIYNIIEKVDIAIMIRTMITMIIN